MRVRVLQHVPYEDIGSMGSWLASRNADVAYTRFYEEPELPPIRAVDFMIIVGGPMSVNDEGSFRWLVKEKAFIREALASRVPILGICLGAQLIASALGSRVYTNPTKEIGWFPIDRILHAYQSFELPSRCLVFHWHGETFDLPPEGIHLGRSGACEQQAFQIGDNVLGLQFHPEATRESVQAMLRNCRHEVEPATWIQSAEEISNVDEQVYRSLNRLTDNVLTYLTKKR